MSEPQWWRGEPLERDRWGELVEPTLARVRRAVERGAMPHALLLVGQAGLGRELAATEVAAMLVCPGSQEPWCTCSSCERARGGVHPDVVRVGPEEQSRQIKIEQVRAVVGTVSGRPYEGRRRVWIFDGVEAGRFGAEAANAFLKTLEEPPGHAVFLLLAANPAAVLPTIRSRCQRLLLPAASTVGAGRPSEGTPPELAAAELSGTPVVELVGSSRAALTAALGGDVLELLRLPARLTDCEVGFEVVASAALELATAEGESDAAEGLARLAQELVAAEQRCRFYNLNRERQLQAALLDWRRSRA